MTLTCMEHFILAKQNQVEQFHLFVQISFAKIHYKGKRQEAFNAYNCKDNNEYHQFNT